MRLIIPCAGKASDSGWIEVLFVRVESRNHQLTGMLDQDQFAPIPSEAKMWALLSTRLRTWLLLAVAIPLAGALARFIAGRLERRHGSTRVSRGLYSVGDLAARRKKARTSAR